MDNLPEFLVNSSGKDGSVMVLAHGAGAQMDSKFMSFFAEHLSLAGLKIIRFEFPYMSKQRLTLIRRPPDRINILKETWRTVIYQFKPENLIIGGKSLGGRIASMVADDLRVKGLVCLGFPFHPPSFPQKLRIDDLQKIATPTLICQGTRDPLGKKSEVINYKLSPRVRLNWIEDGDHDFRPRKRSGHTIESNWLEALKAIKTFAHHLDVTK